MSESPVRGRPRSADIDAAILSATLELIIERGLAGVNIEQVAQAAGVTRATIYRRFPDRVHMILAAIRVGQGAPAVAPVDMTVEQLIGAWADYLSVPRFRRLMRSLMSSLHDLPELHDAYWQASVRAREHTVLATLEAARDRGQFDDDADLPIVRTILTGVIADHVTTQPDTTTATQIAELLMSVLVQAGYRPTLTDPE